MSKLRPSIFYVTAALLLGSPLSALAENWPQWRGPKMDGVSSEKNIPAKWSEKENVAWKVPLPGVGGSTPAVWGEHIFLTSADKDDLVLMALSTEGKVLWKNKLGTGDFTVRSDEGNAASASPCTDGKNVWAYVGSGDIGCYDFKGKEIWKFNLQERYGKFNIQFGMTSSPLLHGDHLYLQMLYTGGKWVVALDKKTGKEVWRHTRESDARDECEHSYASPILYQDAKTAFLLSHGADYTVAHDLKDGKELWRCGGLNPEGNYNPTLRFVASPGVGPGLIVVPSAKNGPVVGLSPSGKGDVTGTSAQLWKRANNTPDVSTPLIHDGLVYLSRESGGLLCLDAKTGSEVYHERTHQARYRASPVYADGKIILVARDGVMTVVKAGRNYELLSENKLETQISASPAIAGGRIYLRGFDALYAIEAK